MKKGDFIELNRHMQLIEHEVSKQLTKELMRINRRKRKK